MKKLLLSLISTPVGKFLLATLSLLMLAGIGVSLGALLLVHPPTVTTAHSKPVYPSDTIHYDTIQQTPAPGAIEVKVTLVEFHISSTLTVFHAGMTYHFTISNVGQQVHEFLIMPDKPDGSPLPPGVQFNQKLIEIEQVAPGSTLTINFTFSPTSAGRYEIACLMRGHYMAGMKLPIRVTS